MNVRQSETAWISKKSNPASQIIRRISKLLSVSYELYEHIQFVRYHTGGFYKAHYDVFCHGLNYFNFDNEYKHGQRSITAIIYLNDDFTGGKRIFLY